MCKVPIYTNWLKLNWCSKSKANKFDKQTLAKYGTRKTKQLISLLRLNAIDNRGLRK